MNKLTVTQDATGQLQCYLKGATGSFVVGRGASVLEAVGAWTVYTADYSIMCDPPSVLRDFRITTPYRDLSFRDCNRR